jgi:hypothetical protein
MHAEEIDRTMRCEDTARIQSGPLLSMATSRADLALFDKISKRLDWFLFVV